MTFCIILITISVLCALASTVMAIICKRDTQDNIKVKISLYIMAFISCGNVLMLSTILKHI